MGFGRYSIFICFFVFLVSPVMAIQCSKQDKGYADFWQNYYTPSDAYAFGLKVQSLVSNGALSGNFSIKGSVLEIADNPLLGWTINETVVHPFCFNRP